MTVYLAGGWYSSGPKGGLRTEVLDGAMDTAGMLHRAGIRPELVSRIALRVRSLVRLGDPVTVEFGAPERAIVASRLESLTGDSAELVSFLADCLDHIGRHADLAALYLHLMHVTRMMQLLALAQGAFNVPSEDPVPRARPARKTKAPAGKRAGSTRKAPVRKTKAPAGKRAGSARKAPVHKTKVKGRGVRRAPAKRPR